jgi:hypothetical protein
MALEGTHMRFALEVRDSFRVKDVKKYISGSIYPDSRYITGVDRGLTHDDSQMERIFWWDDDFKKGWASHILYDKIQYEVHTELFKDILKEGNPEMSWEEDWIVRSALKILQDKFDVLRFNIHEFLDGLDYVETPNGEDYETLKKYNCCYKRVYSKVPNVTVEDIEAMWDEWNVSDENSKRIERLVNEMRKDAVLMKRIEGIYPRTMDVFEDYFQRFCG